MTGIQSNAQEIDPAGLMACPECDALIEKAGLIRGAKALCPRCGCTLYAAKKNPVERTLILSLTGLILFIPAMVLPVMTLNALGLEQHANMIQGSLTLFGSGFHIVGGIVLMSAVLIPLLKLLLLFYVSVALRIRARWNNLAFAFRMYQRMDEWGMLEICMLAILISIIKLKDLAEISYGPGLFCFVALLIITLMSCVCMDDDTYWDLIGGASSAQKNIGLSC
jgi:paraquat-inducible protein A